MSSTIFLAAGDLGESFRTLVDENFIKVDGILVERTKGGYILFGQKVNSLDEVKKIISNGNYQRTE